MGICASSAFTKKAVYLFLTKTETEKLQDFNMDAE